MFPSLSQSLGNSQKEYEKAVVNYSVKNQLRYKGNLGKYRILHYIQYTQYFNNFDVGQSVTQV